MSAVTTTHSDRIALRFILTGRVQGIGLRPAVARLAAEFGIAGSIRNDCDGVLIEAEGSPSAINEFHRRLQAALPASARLADFVCEPAFPAGRDGFSIEEHPATGFLRAEIPRDGVACGACLEEVADPEARRHRYPFTSCSDCGPRFSIVEAMPYERRLTTMQPFELCEKCGSEYRDPRDRRFHAQTIACPECGPQMWSSDSSGRVLARADRSLQMTVAALRAGRIVAVRGLGGYQLLCSATDDAAVKRLRARKRRPLKPLAVMVASLARAEQLAHIDDAGRAALLSQAGPIVLFRTRSGSHLSPDIAPGLDTVGLFLPTTPLHRLILQDFNGPLVVTSGNIEGEPLCTDVDDAQRELTGVADLWLHHDRAIAHALDDSVVRPIAGKAVTIRLARGFAPLPLSLRSQRPLLAVGGHQKASIALANTAQSILGPHIGDLDGLATRERFGSQQAALVALLGMEPLEIVHDLHPDYFTTNWARSQPQRTTGVQHHHTHIAAGMLEHGWIDRQVIGVAFDGTGFGPDGTIWGGEFLLTTAMSFERVGHLRPFALPGGDAAIREPWRVAAAILNAIGGLPLVRAGIGDLPQGFDQLLTSDRLCRQTTSAGRLFDAVAALILGVGQAGFEGYPAMLLEAACDHTERGAYSVRVIGTSPAVLDWQPAIAELLDDRRRGADSGAMASRFHRGLARAIAQLCRQFSPLPAVLGGGVFQNRVLVDMIVEEWLDHGQPLGLPGIIPPNDGGLAAGQLVVAASRLAQERT